MEFTDNSKSSKSSSKLRNSFTASKTFKSIKSKNLSSSKRVIVPTDEHTQGFNLDAYSEDYLGNYITQKEFNEIIMHCSRKMQHFWMWVKDNDKSTLPKNLKLISFVIISTLICYIVAIFLVIDLQLYESMVYFSFFVFVCGTSLTFGMTLYNHCREFEQFKSAETLLKEYLDKYFIEVNEKFTEIEFNYDKDKKHIEIDVLKFRDDQNSNKSGRTRQNDETSQKRNDGYRTLPKSNDLSKQVSKEIK